MKQSKSGFNPNTEIELDDSPVKTVPPVGNFIKTVVWLLMLPFVLVTRIFIGIPTFVFSCTAYIFTNLTMKSNMHGLD